MLVGNVLTTAAIRFPENESVVCTATGRRFRYRETNARSNRLAHGLTGLGFAKGDVVAFLSTNRAEMIEIYFALAKSGIVGIPLNYRLAPAEVVELMRAMDAVGLVCEARFESVANQVTQALPRVRRVVAIGQTALERAEDYEALLERSPAHEPEVELVESDPYYFNLTSGTTGLPKSYVLTQFNNSSIGGFMDGFDLSRRDVVMTVFPMFGRVGFAWTLGAAMFGLKNVLMNFAPAECLALIERERVTIVNLVATMGAMMLAEPTLPERDLSSLRAVVYAGSMLPPTVRDQTIARLCPSLYEYYGMQETGALVLSTPEDRAVRPDSIGRPVMFAEIRVVDPSGRPVPVDEVGEICGRSPNTITEYFDNPAKTAETFRDGWLHTGDLGRIDADGYLYISGRVKDMIITGGQNVHAAEVEAALLAFPGVADCAVIGLPDALWGEAVTAVVVPAGGATIDGDALKAFCRERLAGFKTPKRVVVQTAALPRTPTGKVQKFLLVERYGAAGDA
jgi:acyl-CoA synthetase (AMP-forming)/AMP-acid ligase II